MFKQFIYYLLIAVLIFVILYPKFPLISVAGTYVPIRIEDLLISGVLLIWFLTFSRKLKNILSKTVTQSFMLFWAIGLLTVISAFLVTYFVPLHLGLLHWLRRVETMSLFFVAATTLKNIKQLKRTLAAMVIVTLIVCIYGFGQVFLHFPVISTTNSEFAKGLILELTPGARPNSTFAGHYDLAIYLSIAIIFLGTIFFHYQSKYFKEWDKFIWQKGLMIFATILSSGLLGLTAARASFAATGVGLALAFWTIGRKILILGLIAAGVLIIIISPQLRHRLVATVTVNLLEGGGPKYAAPSLLPKSSNNPASFSAEIVNASNSATGAAKLPRDIAPGEPINVTELGVERSFNIRTDVEWPRAIRALEKNPILGTGYASLADQKGNALATDNDFLRSLGETGILGTAALVLCMFIVLKKITQGIKKTKDLEKLFLVATLYSTIGVILTGTVIDVFEASKAATMLWIMLGAGWAVANDYDL